MSPESLSVTIQPRDRFVGKPAFGMPKGAAVLVCAVVITYLDTEISAKAQFT